MVELEEIFVVDESNSRAHRATCHTEAECQSSKLSNSKHKTTVNCVNGK